MTPPAIVEAARRAGLAIIAICDHNSAGNAKAVQDAAAGTGDLVVLAGMEITTREEVHILGLFPDVSWAETAGKTVRATLPKSTPASSHFGGQRLADARGRLLGVEPKRLAAATTFSLAEAVGVIHGHGGLAVPSHVDRPSFSVMSQLGVFPTDAGFDAIEISASSRGTRRAAAFEAYGLPVITSSDSHSLGEIGAAMSILTAREPTFDELVLALRREGGRGVRRA